MTVQKIHTYAELHLMKYLKKKANQKTPNQFTTQTLDLSQSEASY